jgi:hypothetical protein
MLSKTKYDFLTTDAVLAPGDLELASRQAHEKALHIEQVLTRDFQVKLPAIGQALSKFFGVPYEPFKPDRVTPLDLLKNFKREYVDSNQWLPIDDTKEGLVVLCLDPEGVRSSRIVPNVFTKAKILYRVTTQEEFKDTVNQFYGNREPVPLVPIVLPPRRTGVHPPSALIRDFGSWGEILIHEGSVCLFISNRPPQCFGYEIPGNWGWGSEEGIIQAVDGSGFVGVTLVSANDLRPFNGDTPFAQAATRATMFFEKTLDRQIAMELKAFKTARFNAMKWTGTWPNDSTTIGMAEKIFLEIGAGWLAQITLGTASRDLVLGRLVESFGATPDQKCYWPLLQGRYPGLLKFQ